MNDFDTLEVDRSSVAPKPVDKYYFQKQRLVFNMTRDSKVIDAVLAWLCSFEGGMSKETFNSQIVKLSFDDTEALSQLSRSMGHRSIYRSKLKRDSLPVAGDVVQMLADGTLFIAVTGQDKPLKKFIRSAYQTLKDLGKTYVLDLNELRLEWVEKYKKGRSQEILQRAKECDFLIIEGFQAPLDLPNYILDWINSIRRYRIDNELPMVSTYARFREKEFFFKNFSKYSVK